VIKSKENIGQKLYDSISSKIRSGEWEPGIKLSSYKSFSEEFNISIATVQRVFEVLTRENYIEAVHGKGTFVSQKPFSGVPANNKLNPMIMVIMPSLPELETLRELALKKSILISHYNTSEDLQDPERECLLLNTAIESRCKGVILTPTPKKQVNSAMFSRLRNQGIKLLLTGRYDLEMKGENYLLPDILDSSRTAVLRSALNGYHNFVYLGQTGESLPILIKGLKQGFESAVKEFDLKKLKDIDAYQDEKTLFQELDKLPEKTALISPNGTCLRRIYPYLQKHSNRKLKGVCAFAGPNLKNFDRMYFDYNELIKLALDYICDESISSVDPYQKLFKAQFISGEN
jgi:DNA-binding transcriptional regulator YhcF (GntR family)